MSYLQVQQRLLQRQEERSKAELVKEDRRTKMAVLRRTPLTAAQLPSLPGSIRLAASPLPGAGAGLQPAPPPLPQWPTGKGADGHPSSLAPIRATLRSINPSRSVLVPLGQTFDEAEGSIAGQTHPITASAARRRHTRSTQKKKNEDEEEVPFSKKVVMSQTLLGTGAFGAVYLGVHEETGQMIAVKQITIGSHNNKETQNQIEQLASEIRLMKQLDHPNIVKYLHAERVENQLLIYMELMSGGSLASLVKKFTKLPESVMKVYMRQVLVGVAYLHQKNVVHRDIKADNILLSSDGTAKISDFGTSREFSDSANLLTVTGTPWFMAPEVVKGSEGSGHGAPADIWSLGCTMIELVQGKPPWWKHSNPVTVMYQIGLSPEKIFDEIPESATEQLKQLLRLCFIEEPSQRITAAQILDHPYFAEDDETSASDVSSNVDGEGPTQPTPVLAPRPPSPAPGQAAAGNVPVPVPLHLVRATRSNSPSHPTVGTPKGYASKLRTETQSHQ